jgi:DNA repair exonuclease SbcCD ATPase subunit
MKDLEKTRKNTVAILNASFKARRSLQSFKDKIDKEYEKEYKPLLNDSEKILKSLIKKQCKEMDELEKEHNKVVNEIIKEIDIKISEKLDEYDKIIKEADQDTEEEKRVLKHEQALNKLNKAIKKLEKERKNKVDSEKQKIMSKKKKFRKEFEKTKHRGIKKLEKVDKKHKPLKSELAELFEIQNKIVSELEEEEKTLSLLINLDYVKGEDILVPFYVYRKRDKFGFLPPTKTVGEKGSSFLIMSLIKNSLADKINEQVSPSTMAFNKYFDMVIDTLNNNSTLSQKYKETISELDLLDVRENLVSLIVGLYRLYDWGWINDKEYLLAQTQVVEKIANPINIGNSEISSEQPIETVKQTT